MRFHTTIVTLALLAFAAPLIAGESTRHFARRDFGESRFKDVKSRFDGIQSRFESGHRFSRDVPAEQPPRATPREPNPNEFRPTPGVRVIRGVSRDLGEARRYVATRDRDRAQPQPNAAGSSSTAASTADNADDAANDKAQPDATPNANNREAVDRNARFVRQYHEAYPDEPKYEAATVVYPPLSRFAGGRQDYVYSNVYGTRSAHTYYGRLTHRVQHRKFYYPRSYHGYGDRYYSSYPRYECSPYVTHHSHHYHHTYYTKPHYYHSRAYYAAPKTYYTRTYYAPSISIGYVHRDFDRHHKHRHHKHHYHGRHHRGHHYGHYGHRYHRPRGSYYGGSYYSNRCYSGGSLFYGRHSKHSSFGIRLGF